MVTFNIVKKFRGLGGCEFLNSSCVIMLGTTNTGVRGTVHNVIENAMLAHHKESMLETI